MPPAALPQSSHPRSSALVSYGEGWRRVGRAPILVLGVLAAGLFAFATAPGLGGAGAGLLPGQVDGAWLLVHEAFGLGIGPGGPVPLADAVAGPAVVSAFLLYLAFSAALWGGILDRLARQRRVGTGPFWAACGVHGVRFVRLYMIVVPVYAAVFRWLFPLLLAAAARLVDGSDGMLLLGVASVGLAPLLAGVGVVLEFARVRIVVEDRHSAIGAVAAAARFIRRRPGRVTLLYTINLAAVWLLVAAWSSVQADPSTVAGWLAAVVWLVLRIAARLASAGAAIAFFQSELAHAGYVAAPIPMWPDSPTVEGLRNLRI